MQLSRLQFLVRQRRQTKTFAVLSERYRRLKRSLFNIPSSSFDYVDFKILKQFIIQRVYRKRFQAEIIEKQGPTVLVDSLSYHNLIVSVPEQLTAVTLLQTDRIGYKLMFINHRGFVFPRGRLQREGGHRMVPNTSPLPYGVLYK